MLFNNTNYWFLVFDTLSVILALYYSAFLSSSKRNNMHDLMRKNRSFSVRTRHPETIKTSICPEERAGGLQGKRKFAHQRIRTLENRLPIVPASKPGKPCRVYFQAKGSEKSLNRVPAKIISGQDVLLVPKRATCEKRKITPTTLQRSKSEDVKRVVIDESKNIVWRFETVWYEPSEVESDEERDEYACLSNEELNRRVEDFIQRFNMEIRLQRSEALVN